MAQSSRKATIFLGTKKYEVTSFDVTRRRYAQYEDAYHIEFKPKGARNLRSYDDYAPRTVILDGWGHPEFDLLIRGFRDAPFVELSQGVSYKTIDSELVQSDVEGKNKYEIEFEEYLKNCDPSLILLDTRGTVIKGKQ